MTAGFLPPLPTGLADCYDAQGARVDCTDAWQDASNFPVIVPPYPRFAVLDKLVEDRLTGLTWTRDANPAGPLSWPEALAFVADLNARTAHGHADWRLPNRRELRSLACHGAKDPALPAEHPFLNVVGAWTWTSTTAAIAPAYAWRLHLAGARMFYGAKTEDSLVWPVRGASDVLARTGQNACFDAAGLPVPRAGTGQDGELQTGVPWPEPRFARDGDAVRDLLTGLTWSASADLAKGPVTWERALGRLERLRDAAGEPWRLPDVNELESLVDASRHSPALPKDHPFADAPEACWSSTTSFYDPAWAYCLYLRKGAVGVGYKPGPEFFVWAVR